MYYIKYYKRYNISDDMKRVWRYVMYKQHSINKAISHVYSTWLYKEWNRNLNEGNIWIIYYFSLAHATPHSVVWDVTWGVEKTVSRCQMIEARPWI